MADLISLRVDEPVYSAGSTVSVTVNCRTRSTAAASTPSSIRYRVDCLTNRCNVINWTSVSAASSASITVPGTSNGTIDYSQDLETRQITVEIDTGLSTQVRAAATWKVRTIRNYVLQHEFQDDLQLEAYNPITAAEITAGVTPTSFQYPPGDVRRYGAVGDGTTDDTTALINAGKSFLDVYIPPSFTCRVTGSLAAGIQSGQRWHGGGTITTANGFNHHVFDISGKTDVTVEGLVATAGTLGVSYSTATARFFRCTSAAHRCKLLYCKITGFQSAAQLNASEHCQVIGNDIITPDGWGVNVQTDAHDSIVAWNRINGVVSEHGIYVAGSSGDPVRAPHIHDNIITGCGGEGIKNTNADDSHIHDNVTYSNTGEGIYIGEGSTRAAVHDNTSYANAQNGILVFTSVNGATVDGTRVANNHVYENGKDGIRAQVNHAAATVSNTTIAFNEIDDNNQDASTFRGVAATITAGTLSGVTILQNRIINETTGVLIGSSVTGAVIEHNKFASNTTDISDSGTGTIIRQPGSIETRTGAGAVSLLTEITLIVTTGVNALTLADGYEGQRKFLKMKTDGGDGTLTPTNLAGGTTITFDDAGDSADLVFLDGEWCMVGGSATLA